MAAVVLELMLLSVPLLLFVFRVESGLCEELDEVRNLVVSLRVQVYQRVGLGVQSLTGGGMGAVGERIYARADNAAAIIYTSRLTDV